jgi:competence protein ComEC
MPTILHFIDVGQGNMTLIELANGMKMVYDCRVTDDNEERVLRHLRDAVPGRHIHFFVNSHREADHNGGVERIHREFSIGEVWDCGVTGTTTGSIQYERYMNLRRDRPCITVKPRTYYDFGATRVRVLHAGGDGDANDGSIILKIEHRRPDGTMLSALLPGDADATPWPQIVRFYGAELASNFLLGGHHGAETFFKFGQRLGVYTDHLRHILPDVTIISVGSNSFGHPDRAAVQRYEAGSLGCSRGRKIFRTDTHGSIRAVLPDSGGWTMSWPVPVPVPTPTPSSDELLRALSLLPGATPPPSLGLGTIASIAGAMSRYPAPALPPQRTSSLYDALLGLEESPYTRFVRSLATPASLPLSPRPPQESPLALFARSILNPAPRPRTLADSALTDALRYLSEECRWS